MTIANSVTIEDLSEQILGTTDSHIHYFEQTPLKEPQQAAHAKVLGIHKLMLSDFQALVNSAEQSNITLKIASGFRTFERQLLIWNNKFSGKAVVNDIHGEAVDISKLNDIEIINAILLYSALPGASRHHWGCDIDIYAENLLDGHKLQLETWEYEESGPMASLTSWLSVNAAKHGFYLPYDSFRGGVATEPWHLSYAPLANQYQSKLSLALLKQALMTADILGKSAIIENLPEIFSRYINNVNTTNPLLS